MAQVIRQQQPLDIGSDPGRLPLRQQLRRCSCGCLTFLDLPCRRCGRSRLQPEFSRAHLCGKKRVLLYIVGIVVTTLAAMRLVAILQPWLALLPAALTVILVTLEWKNGGQSLYDTFFLFHRDRLSGKKGQTNAADAECLFALQEAYDSDLLRLEKMLEKLKPMTDCGRQAEQLFLQARQLATVYHNRRLSALMAHCLLLMQPEEGIHVDMEEVCRFLYPQDLEDAANEGTLLRWLDSWVKASCLPVGEHTARTLVRICALRVESAAVGIGPSESCEKIIYAKQCQLCFTKLESSMIQAIWAASGLGRNCCKQRTSVLDQWRKMEQAGGLNRPLRQAVWDHLAARYWADICWYDWQKMPYFEFRALVSRSANLQERQLLEIWGRQSQEEAEA